MFTLILFFDPNSAVEDKATLDQINHLIRQLKKTLLSIRSKNKKALIHSPLKFTNWLLDRDRKLVQILDELKQNEVRQLIKSFLCNHGPVTRFFEHIDDESVEHEGKKSMALTAAVCFKSAVLSFHQGVWVYAQLNASQRNANVCVANFSSEQHVKENAILLTQKNVPIELLSYDQKVKAPHFDSHGQKVYTNGKEFITPDVDEHNISKGWKKFDRYGNRLGTYDANLQSKIGD